MPGTRHRAHGLKRLTPELIARHDWPMGLGAVIKVDTNAPVDFPALMQRVREAPPR